MKYKHANLKNTRVQCLAGLKNKQKNSLVGEKANYVNDGCSHPIAYFFLVF